MHQISFDRIVMIKCDVKIELASLVTYLFFSLDQVKQFPLFSILEYYEDVTAGIDELKVLDNVWVIEAAQHLDLPFDFLKDALELNLTLVQNFYRHFMTSKLIYSNYRGTRKRSD